MAEEMMSFPQRFQRAIRRSCRHGESFDEKVHQIHGHIRGRGVQGTHGTLRSLRRWIQGRGTPPPYIRAMIAEYLSVPLKVLTPDGDQGSRRSAIAPPIPASRWANEPVYIIGGGPSAARHDLTKLDGVVVGVNDSAVHLPNADAVFTASPPWVRHRGRFLRDFAGMIVVQCEYPHQMYHRLHLPPGSHTIPLRRIPGLSEKERRLGHNSGQEALHWVADQGARRIILVGFDLHEPRNWHGVYEWQPDKSEDPTFDYPRWIRNFSTSALMMRDRDIKVWNANDQSAIRCFPFLDLTVPRRKVPGLTCAVIIPVGPGHEEYSEAAEASIRRAWEHDSGPFEAMTVHRVWDVDGQLGRGGARNKGLDEHPADWHFLLDADDAMMPDAFRYVELEAPATFGAVLLDGKLSSANRWPVSWDTIRHYGAHGTLSMGFFLQGDLGLRFREDMPVGQDWDLYTRLPGFAKVRRPLANIGYRKPRAGTDPNQEPDREAVNWLNVCRAIIDAHFAAEETTDQEPSTASTIGASR